MKKLILLFMCIGLFGFFGFQNSKDFALLNISSFESQESVKFKNWVDKNSYGSPLIVLESGCKSFSTPPPPCICPTPEGECVYVFPNVTCYNGTQPICP